MPVAAMRIFSVCQSIGMGFCQHCCRVETQLETLDRIVTHASQNSLSIHCSVLTCCHPAWSWTSSGSLVMGDYHDPAMCMHVLNMHIPTS